MFDPKKIDLLDNYQLYQLSISIDLDNQTKKMVLDVLNDRKIDQKELERIKQKAELANPNLFTNKETHNIWDALLTPYLGNKHFVITSNLKNSGQNELARNYQLAHYFGYVLYSAITIVILLILLNNSDS